MTDEQVDAAIRAKDQATTDVKVDVRHLIEEAVRGTSRDLKVSSQELATYVAERAAILSTLVGQPGFARAVEAERDNVMLKAAIIAGREASAVDQRLVGIIQSALMLGARVVAGA